MHIESAWLKQYARSGRYSGKLLRISIVKCVCIYKAVQLKSKLQYTRNLTDRSMTIPPRVLSPSSILPPPFSNGAFIPARKNSARISEM